MMGRLPVLAGLGLGHITRYCLVAFPALPFLEQVSFE